MCLRVGDRISDSTLQYLGDLPDFGHKLVELLRVKRLLAVTECAVGIGMNFDDEAVCAHGNSSPRQRRNFVALACAVAGIDDDGQMTQSLYCRHNAEIKGITRVIGKGAHPALAQDNVVVTLAHDVLGSHQELFYRC